MAIASVAELVIQEREAGAIDAQIAASLDPTWG
jgi:hypothetical protein